MGHRFDGTRVGADGVRVKVKPKPEPATEAEPAAAEPENEPVNEVETAAAPETESQVEAEDLANMTIAELRSHAEEAGIELTAPAKATKARVLAEVTVRTSPLDDLTGDQMRELIDFEELDVAKSGTVDQLRAAIAAAREE